MEDVTAKGVPFVVVSCQKTGDFILRGIKKFSNPAALQAMMLPYVAIINGDDLEWTHHTYHVPYYLEYGDGDIPRRSCATDGIYLHKWQAEDHYGPGKQLKGL